MGLAFKARVICRWGRKNLRYTYDGNKEFITVLECVSTGEYLLLPLIVIKGAYHYAGNHIQGQDTPESMYAYSPKGWTTNKLGLL